MNSKRPVILFDVMETLVTEPFFTAMPDFFGMSLEQLLAAKHPTSWIEFEKGRLSEAEFLAQFFLDGRPVDRAGLRECLRNSYRWIDGMEELANDLVSHGFELHALSNYPVWYELIDETLGLSRYLKWTFVSWRTGLRKPDRQAYLHAAAHLPVEPGECLFIDDREENIAAAIEAGMDAVLKVDAGQVRHELAQRSLLPARHVSR